MAKITLQGQEIEISTIKGVDVEGSILKLLTCDGELEFFHKGQEIAELNKVEIEKLKELEMDKSKEIIELFAREKSRTYEPYQYQDRDGKLKLIQLSDEERKLLKEKKITISELEKRRDEEQWQI